MKHYAILFSFLATFVVLSTKVSAQEKQTRTTEVKEPVAKPMEIEQQKKEMSPAEYAAPAAPKKESTPLPVGTTTNTPAEQPRPATSSPQTKPIAKPVKKVEDRPSGLMPQERIIMHEGIKDTTRNSPR